MKHCCHHVHEAVPILTKDGHLEGLACWICGIHLEGPAHLLLGRKPVKISAPRFYRPEKPRGSGQENRSEER